MLGGETAAPGGETVTLARETGALEWRCTSRAGGCSATSRRASEDWRPDYDRFTRADRGYRIDGWAGERWLDIRSENLLAVMLDRLDLAVDKSCDGVEPDNMDAYTNRSGFRLTADDPLGWNKRIANEAHLPALAVALKNDGDQAAALVEHFDLSVNEQCHEYAECDQLAPFISAGKLRRVAGYRPFVDRDEHRAAFHPAVVSPLGGSTNGR